MQGLAERRGDAGQPEKEDADEHDAQQSRGEGLQGSVKVDKGGREQWGTKFEEEHNGA